MISRSYSHFYYWGGPNRHDLWLNGTEIWNTGRYFPNMMVDEAGKFMATNKSKPFYMYFAINMPHYPLQGEKKVPDGDRKLLHNPLQSKKEELDADKHEARQQTRKVNEAANNPEIVEKLKAKYQAWIKEVYEQ